MEALVWLSKNANKDAQAVKAEYKDASGVEEKDGRFYVMKVVPS